ncbi:MAG: TolC family protein, partial [Bacteroidota bacterium]
IGSELIGIMNYTTRFFLLIVLSVLGGQYVQAQDTLQINFEEFKQKAFKNSGQLRYASTAVELSYNREDQARNQRFLPDLRYVSEHALVPGVTSDSILANGQPLPAESYYLDPNAENNWNEWGTFNRFRVMGAQPLFTWGAIQKAVNAAEAATEASEFELEGERSEFELRLFELYYSYTLALEIERLLNDAQENLDKIGEQIEELAEDGDEELSLADEYRFMIFKEKFEIQKVEVQQSLEFVKRTWAYALGYKNQKTVYEPTARFLEPIFTEFASVTFYEQMAMSNRPELRALRAGKRAYDHYVSSVKAQNLPGLFLGFQITMASTPVRPRQPNAFIINPENTFNTALGLTIRQNLNMLQFKTALERSKIEAKRINYLQDAASDGIFLEVSNTYRDALVSETKVTQTKKALSLAKEWLRQEQLDYDLGFGDTKSLIEAIQQDLELRLEVLESTFVMNSNIAKLHKAAAIPLPKITTN